ncbi:PorT family protein [Candidatus Mcinerneyibacteriota bacterium]|nr:PorT family protein [Candidatus Mcinerneyibacteriota bacterium]
MKKVMISLILIVAVVAMATALDLNYGLRTGLAIDNMAVDPDISDLEPSLEKKMKMGFYCGIWARHMMNEKMGITAELNYVEQGKRYADEGSGYTEYFYMIQNVLELPILFTYLPMEKMTLYAGPVLGYALSGGYKMVADWDDPDVTEHMGYDFGEWLNRFQFSAAAGIKYEITETFFGEVRYTYGFSNIINEDQELFIENIEAIPRTLTIGMGINL